MKPAPLRVTAARAVNSPSGHGVPRFADHPTHRIDDPVDFLNDRGFDVVSRRAPPGYDAIVKLNVVNEEGPLHYAAVLSPS